MTSAAMTALTGQVRRKLNITWSDPDTDARVADIMAAAAAHLLYQLGISDADFDFSAAGIENTLFLAYCLYEWNHALDEFEQNYLGMILAARARHEVGQAAGYDSDSGDANEDEQEGL